MVRVAMVRMVRMVRKPKSPPSGFQPAGDELLEAVITISCISPLCGAAALLALPIACVAVV
jgi:hypothetical protein